MSNSEDHIFEAWWLMHGASFEQKLGFKATKYEIAKYPFKAGCRTAGIPGIKTLFVPEGELDAESKGQENE